MLTKYQINSGSYYSRSFYGTNTVSFSSESLYKEKRPTGIYDENILCENCDSYLNTSFDNYAKQVLIDRKGIISEIISDPLGLKTPIKIYRLINKSGYDKLSRFFISILWRASISSQKDVIKLNLGFYEEIAKKTILDDKFDFSRFFSVTICAVTNYPGPVNSISAKLTRTDNGVNFYSFIIGSCKIFIKCDKRKLPDSFKICVLSKENDVLMLEQDAKMLPEYKAIFNMIKDATDYKKLKRSLQKN